MYVRDIVGNNDAVERLQVISEEGNMPNIILSVRPFLMENYTSPVPLFTSQSHSLICTHSWLNTTQPAHPRGIHPRTDCCMQLLFNRLCD